MYNLRMEKYKELFLTTTDTVVGIGAPVSVKNLQLINELKKSPKNKRLVIMVSSLEEAQKLKHWDKKVNEFAKNNWPGALTIVVNENLAVRVPNNKSLQELLKEKGPCYMTSANFSSQNHLSLEEARKTFYEIKNYYDFGPQSNKASKIIDFKTRKVLR